MDYLLNLNKKIISKYFWYKKIICSSVKKPKNYHVGNNQLFFHVSLKTSPEDIQRAVIQTFNSTLTREFSTHFLDNFTRFTTRYHQSLNNIL